MLKIDLLPGHFAAARAAKTMLVVMLVAILVTVLGCFGMLTMKKAELGRVTQDRDEWKVKADEVRKIETDAGAKEALAAPIDAKVSFIEDADGCGEQWWDAYEKVNRYIYAQARVTTIRLQAPSSVHFEVDLPDTTSVGRFVLNLIRCPDISGIRIGGAPPAGPGVGPNARASGGGGGGMGMGGMPGGMPGMGGGMPGGMPGMGGPGGPEMGMMGGGMPGMGGGGARASSSAAGGPIHLTVDATLTKPLATPAPGGGAAAAAAGGGMGMGGMPGGMPGGGMPGGMPGGGMPSMGGPGGAGGAAPGPPAGGGPKAAAKGGGDEGGGGGLGKKGGGDMETE